MPKNKKKNGINNRILRFISFLAVQVIFLSCLISCAKAENVPNSDSDNINIYYVNREKTALSPEKYLPLCDIEDTEAMIEELIAALKAAPSGIATGATITGDINLRSFVLSQGGLLSLDFDVSYSGQDEISEILTRSAIVRTLIQIKGVDGVMFLVGGVALMDRYSNPVGIMTEDSFIFNAGKEMHTYDKVRITLYFANESGDGLVPIYRTLVYNSNMSMERLIVEQLIAGPNIAGAYPTIDPATRVNNVTVQDGICYVDFSEEANNKLNNIKSDVILYSIVNSLAERLDVDRVQITVAGSAKVGFVNDIPLQGPFEKNTEIVISR